jgi:hypothetical protein
MLERRAGADQGDQVGCVNPAPVDLGGFDVIAAGFTSNSIGARHAMRSRERSSMASGRNCARNCARPIAKARRNSWRLSLGREPGGHLEHVLYGSFVQQNIGMSLSDQRSARSSLKGGHSGRDDLWPMASSSGIRGSASLPQRHSRIGACLACASIAAPSACQADRKPGTGNHATSYEQEGSGCAWCSTHRP